MLFLFYVVFYNLISHEIGCIDHYYTLSWLSPFAANITDCCSHCCCAATMAILCVLEVGAVCGPSSGVTHIG